MRVAICATLSVWPFRNSFHVHPQEVQAVFADRVYAVPLEEVQDEVGMHSMATSSQVAISSHLSEPQVLNHIPHKRVPLIRVICLQDRSCIQLQCINSITEVWVYTPRRLDTSWMLEPMLGTQRCSWRTGSRLLKLLLLRPTRTTMLHLCGIRPLSRTWFRYVETARN